VARHTATVGFESSLGTIEVEAAPEGVTRVRLSRRSRVREVGTGAALEHARFARDELTAYLEGRLRVFTVPVVVNGTQFQKAAWGEIARIPYGRSITYGQLANLIGRPHSARAVGTACAANPVPLLIPCHRVLAGNGSLGGFAGGVDLKRSLLALERASVSEAEISK
jgi:methylated-DNA-[protein]-cysteine S-methyltransferase